MRNPVRKALYCLLALLAAAALTRLGIGREQSIGEDWTAILPIFIGLGIAPFALVFLIQALFAVRGQAKLLRGEGVIARWQVFPGEWRQSVGSTAAVRPIASRSATICGSASATRWTRSM